MKMKYFAWIRERVGLEEEDVSLPDDVSDIGALLAWQATRGEQYAAAFSDPQIIRVALDMKLENDLTKPLTGVSEIALFPPMTGG